MCSSMIKSTTHLGPGGVASSTGNNAQRSLPSRKRLVLGVHLSILVGRLRLAKLVALIRDARKLARYMLQSGIAAPGVMEGLSSSWSSAWALSVNTYQATVESLLTDMVARIRS